MKQFSGMLAVFALAGLAQASLVASPVATSLVLSNADGSVTQAVSGNVNKETNFRDIGVVLGNFGASDIRSTYAANDMFRTGPHGGEEYLVTVRVGSMTTGRFGVNYYQSAIINAGATLAGGAVINRATISFGATGGGVKFNDFGASTVLYVNNSDINDLGYSEKMDTGFGFFDEMKAPNADQLLASPPAATPSPPPKPPSDS